MNYADQMQGYSSRDVMAQEVPQQPVMGQIASDAAALRDRADKIRARLASVRCTVLGSYPETGANVSPLTPPTDGAVGVIRERLDGVHSIFSDIEEHCAALERL